MHGSGGAGEQSGFGIALVHLYPVVVAACHKQVFAVRRYGKVTRVFASVLVSDFFERAVGLDFEYCYAVVFQPYACVQELAVGAYVNVGSAACSCVAGFYNLFLREQFSSLSSVMTYMYLLSAEKSMCLGPQPFGRSVRSGVPFLKSGRSSNL